MNDTDDTVQEGGGEGDELHMPGFTDDETKDDPALDSETPEEE